MRKSKLKISLWIVLGCLVQSLGLQAQEYDDMYFTKSDREQIKIIEQVRAENIIKQLEQEKLYQKNSEQITNKHADRALAKYERMADSIRRADKPNDRNVNPLYSSTSYYNVRDPQWSASMGWNYFNSPGFGSGFGNSFSLSYGNAWNNNFYDGFYDPFFSPYNAMAFQNGGILYDPFDPFYSDFYYNNFGYRHYSPWAWNNRLLRNRFRFGNYGNFPYFRNPNVIIVNPTNEKPKEIRKRDFRPTRVRPKNNNTEVRPTRSRSRTSPSRSKTRSRVRSSQNNNSQNNTQRSRTTNYNNTNSSERNYNTRPSRTRSRSRSSYSTPSRSRSRSSSQGSGSRSTGRSRSRQ